MRKKTFDLICSVGELTGIFHKKTNINGLLHIVVKLIARHMHTEACSIFLLDKNDRNLVLRASHGLNPDMINVLSLAPGEGITWRSLEESKPILVPKGSDDPDFMYIDGIYEDTYESFLAVPILHSRNKLGVIVLEDSRPDYYNDRDRRALAAIASQLAAFLENAKLLLELRNRRKEEGQEEKGEETGEKAGKDFYKGEPASEGIAMGQAVLVSGGGGDLLLKTDKAAYRTGIEDFEDALEKTKQQLRLLQQHMEDGLSEVGSLIFGSHLLMLSDDDFSGSMRSAVEDGMAPAEAIEKVVNDYVMLFINSKQLNIQEKVHDVKDLGHRLLKNLLPEGSEEGNYSGQIVLAKNLLPSELVKIGVQNTEGFVLYGAGMTSHLSILAKSLEVPVILINDNDFFSDADGKQLIIDAFQGSALIEAGREVCERYRELKEEKQLESRGQDPAASSAPIIGSDGREVELLANINILSDVEAAKRAGARGVGLYRSEFLFLIRNDFPTEEEQRLIYRKLLESIDHVTFRTFDLGGDKVLRSINPMDEKNPFMGLRSLRYSMRHIDLFKTQLRAILRAGIGKDVRVLFPLVAGVEDFLEAREVLEDCMEELRSEDLPFSEDVKVGAMIELPSAALMCEEIGKVADFLSLGTNDLVQYVLGVDRTNDEISELYDPSHPGVLKMLDLVADGARRASCPLSVCGNTAADPQMLKFFIERGIRSFSVDPRSYKNVRRTLKEIAASIG